MAAPARTCACPHAFPLCACGLGVRGALLLHESRMRSALAGWPGPLVPELVAEHAARVRAAKPRLPLGVNQRAMPPAATPGGDCGCGK